MAPQEPWLLAVGEHMAPCHHRLPRWAQQSPSVKEHSKASRALREADSPGLALTPSWAHLSQEAPVLTSSGRVTSGQKGEALDDRQTDRCVIKRQTGGSQEPGDNHMAVADVCLALYVLKLRGEMTKPKPKPQLSRFGSNITNTELTATA